MQKLLEYTVENCSGDDICDFEESSAMKGESLWDAVGPTLCVRTEMRFGISAWGSSVQRKFWVATQPFNAHALARLVSFCLTTNSGHQGLVMFGGQGSCSWFEIAIIPEEKGRRLIDFSCVKKQSDGTPLSWPSHHHPVKQHSSTSIISGKISGKVFDTQHELFGHLNPGDSLAVFGCAQHPLWSCHGESAELLLSFDDVS